MLFINEIFLKYHADIDTISNEVDCDINYRSITEFQKLIVAI